MYAGVVVVVICDGVGGCAVGIGSVLVVVVTYGVDVVDVVVSIGSDVVDVVDGVYSEVSIGAGVCHVRCVGVVGVDVGNVCVVGDCVDVVDSGVVGGVGVVAGVGVCCVLGGVVDACV